MERGTGFFAGVAVGLAEVRTGFFVGLLVVVVVLVDMFAVVSKKMCSSTSSSSDGVDGFAQMWLKSARRWRRFQLFQVSNDRVALFRTLIDIVWLQGFDARRRHSILSPRACRYLSVRSM